MAEGDAALSSEPPMGQEERPYKCKQCPRSYRHAGSLVNHRRTHEVGLFRCLLCHKDFSNPMSLKSHLRTHTEEKRHKCPDCGRSFRVSSQLPSHHCPAQAIQEQEKDQRDGSYSFQRGHGTSSPAVDSRSGMEGNSGSLLSNLEKYIAESVVPADYSQQEFPIKMKEEKQDLLPGHEEDGEESGLLAAMEDERRYKCNQCDKAYKHPGSLTNHKQSHTLGVYQCVICYKEFSNLMALRSHARLHSEYRPYKCRFCHKAFRLPSELLSHQKAHSQEESKSTDPSAWEDLEHDVWEEDSIETSAKLDIYQPPPVGTGFGDRVPCSLKDTSKAGGGERCNPDGELCVRCGGTFADEEELKEHSCLYPKEADEEEEAEGSSPSQAAPSSNEAWEARLKSEEGFPMSEERPFRCGDCGRTYRHAGSLINHRKSHQIGVYSCTVCSKQLYNLAALKNHLRVHLRSKLNSSAPEEASQHPSGILDPSKAQDYPDNCPTRPSDAWRGPAACPKEEEERNLGEEERPFRCEDCGRSYRHRGSLVNHRHTHQTGIFQCSICPKQYSNLMALRNHVRVHLRAARMRGKELGDGLTCSNCGESFEEEAEFQLHQLRHLPCTEDIEAAEVPRLGVLHSQEADLLQTIKQDVEALENGATVAEDILPASEMPQICHQCGLAFPTVASLQIHAVQHGSERERLEGVVEGTEPPVPIQRLYECELCGKSYRHSGSLINHKQTHQTGDFSCSLCSKHFQNVASLKSHLRGHQRPRRGLSETLVTTNEDTDTEAGATMPMALSLAEELRESCSVLEKDAIANDWQTQSQASSPLPDDSEGLPYLCEQCGLGFHQAKNLIDHRQTHQAGIYQCSLCPKEYPTLLALKHHFHGHAKSTASGQDNPMGEGHTEEQPFLCSLCGMIFPSEESLQDHHSLLHEEGEGRSDSPHVLKRETEEQLDGRGDPEEEQLFSHICGYCGQTFDDMASLEEHSNGHLEEKAAALADTSIQLRRAPRMEDDPPHPPPPLVETFPLADDLLDSRPYACGQCGKTYRHGGSLVNHKKIHLIGDYQCSICCRQYRNLSAYRNHLRNHPRCKMNGSIPQLRQLIPAAERGLPCTYERLKDEPCGASQNGEAPPSNSFLACPIGKERVEQGEELSSGLSKSREAQECDVPGEGNETMEAHQAIQEMETTEKEEEGAAEEKGPQAEEEDSLLERPFQCDVCGRSYKHAGSLINHKQTHKTGLFHCSICQKQFYNLMALKNHNRTHFETKRYRCAECPKAFRLQKQLASHQRVHRDRRPEPAFHLVHQRPLRAKRASKAEMFPLLLAPAKQLPDPEERPYRCAQCGRSYRHAGSLLNHQKSHKVGHFPCPLCSKAYPNLMSLKNHQRIHYEVKRHQCPDCGKAFKWQRQLQRHQRRPHPCSKIMPGQEIERTRADCERDQGTNPGEAPVGTLQNQPRRKCFRNRASQKNHSCVRAKKRLECSDCGKAYQASRDLMQHLRRHQAEEKGDSPKGKLPEDQLYKCHSCERTYRQPGSLLNHKKAHATGLYHCPSCQRDFYNLLALKNHLHIHMDKRRHRCPHCGKAFRTAKRLATHTKVHGRPEGEETFSCPVCSKRFFHHLTFQQHQLLHTKFSTGKTKMLSSSKVSQDNRPGGPTLERRWSRKGRFPCFGCHGGVENLSSREHLGYCEWADPLILFCPEYLDPFRI
uniref:Zinc finger protein 646 n=1 Tax=Laticauda laticaudata TaxID=8630 RepID=A0A8C5SYB7_LATLA